MLGSQPIIIRYKEMRNGADAPGTAQRPATIQPTILLPATARSSNTSIMCAGGAKGDSSGDTGLIGDGRDRNGLLSRVCILEERCRKTEEKQAPRRCATEVATT